MTQVPLSPVLAGTGEVGVILLLEKGWRPQVRSKASAKESWLAWKGRCCQLLAWERKLFLRPGDQGPSSEVPMATSAPWLRARPWASRSLHSRRGSLLPSASLQPCQPQQHLPGLTHSPTPAPWQPEP